MFLNINKKLVNVDTIEWVDHKNITSHGYIRIYYKDGGQDYVDGGKAVEVMMRLCPAALEGRQMKYIRHRWAIHNLIGHPLMQLCSWLGYPSFGISIHDATVPNPIVQST